jgi:hypothetical protein
MDDDIDMMPNDEETDQALAAIQAQLKSYTTSPLLSQTIGGNARDDDDDDDDNYYSMDPMQWMQEKIRGASPASQVSPKRTPLLQRAGTPVMSNSSSKQNLSSKTAAGVVETPRNNHYHDENEFPRQEEDDEEMEIEPVQTPAMIRRTFKPASVSTTSTTTSNANLNQHTFRRYHDALLSYLHTKRSLTRRLDLEKEEHLLTGLSDTADNYDLTALPMASSQSLAEQECRAEMDFLKALGQVAYDKNVLEEGHLWHLLVSLRQLGHSSLVWRDDSTSSTQHESSISFFVQQITARVHSSPKEVLDDLSSKQIPEALKRKRQLVLWIQSCLQEESKEMKSKLPRSITPLVPTRSYPDDLSVTSSVSDVEADLLKKMFQVCLCEILEGNISRACEVATGRGQPVKAALWTGGEPQGVDKIPDDTTQTVDIQSTGNPNRFVWKRQVWKSGQSLHQQLQQTRYGSSVTNTTEEEAAIYSVLANDVDTALANPCLRNSWTKSLCVLLSGVWSRIEDDVLHRHNNNRRRNSRPGFPGCQYEQEEMEHMEYTAKLQGMREGQVATRMQTDPFLQQRLQKDENAGQFSYKSAMLAFVVGKSAILDFCGDKTNQMVGDIKELSLNSGNAEPDWLGLRFLTHFMLFLDSLTVSTTPLDLEDVTTQKNRVLFEYVKYLESRPDLWHMLALYVSLLPEPTILDYFPTVLVKVLADSERKLMTGQIRDLMPQAELPLLRKVVRIILSSPTHGDIDSDSLDAIKCGSLQWLLQDDKHLGDALICSNMLLRQFLLDEDDDKMDIAMSFLNESLPEDLLGQVYMKLSGGDNDEAEGENNSDYKTKVSNAHSEHRGYVSYLDAYRTFGQWKEVLKETTCVLDSQDTIDPTNLNEIERDVANRAFRKHWLREKRKSFETVLEITEAARSALEKVLTHPGGWLVTDDEESSSMYFQGTDEEQFRRQEISKIRSRHLVLAVNLYLQVCEETAKWISISLDDAESIGMKRDDVLNFLDSDTIEQGGSSSSPFSPTFWYRHCEKLLPLVASDTYGIYTAFSPLDLKEFLGKLAETSVGGLMAAASNY